MAFTNRDRERMADQMTREVNGIERTGVSASRVVMGAIQTAAVNALRNGFPPESVVRSRMLELQPIMRDALITGHLRGYRRAQITAEKARRNAGLPPLFPQPMAAGAYTETIALLQQRTRLTDEQLAVIRQQYQTVAFTVTNEATGAVERSIQKTMLDIRAKNLVMDEALDEFALALKRNGITARSSSLVETMYRTQAGMSYNVGRQRANESPEIDSILWGYQYFTVGDDRVRPSHAAMDGMRAPKDDPLWQRYMPVNGYRCRCTVVEIYDTDRNKTRRPPPDTVVDDATDELVPVVPDPGFDVNFANVLPR